MSADVRAFIELMRPKNMVLAAITVPLGALFGLNASLNEEQLIAVIIQIFSVLAFMGAGRCRHEHVFFHQRAVPEAVLLGLP